MLASVSQGCAQRIGYDSIPFGSDCDSSFCVAVTLLGELTGAGRD